MYSSSQAVKSLLYFEFQRLAEHWLDVSKPFDQVSGLVEVFKDRKVAQVHLIALCVVLRQRHCPITKR